jgi:uncharacterized protein involved in exopolysaccharide biosynthesis
MSGVRQYVEAHAIRSLRSGGDAPPSISEVSRDDLFDWQRFRRHAALSARSIRRRWSLFLFVSAGMVLLAAGALAVLPRTYEVEARLLAQRNAVLSVRADSGPGQPEPTRAVAETILQRDNLYALLRQADLLQEWPRHRAPLQSAKDWLLRALHRAPSEKDLAQGLIELLEKNFEVWTTPDGAVTIRLRWPDPVMAYRLVDAAQQNFLERRHLLEVSTIVEQISILEAHAAQLKNDVETQVAQLQRLRVQSAASGTRPAPPPAPASLVDPETLNLKVKLNAKQRAIADLEEFWRRHLVELQTKLAEQRAIYSENHPIVLDLERSIESFRKDSPQLAALRAEEADLRRRLSASSEETEESAPQIPAELFRDTGTEDPPVEYARAQLRYATQQYAAMRARIHAARIDLDTARAAFKYRYAVIAPPQVPRGPIRPKVPQVMLAAVLAGLLLALVATTAADLREGLVLDRWQLEELLPAQTIVKVRLPWPPIGGLPPPDGA